MVRRAGYVALWLALLTGCSRDRGEPSVPQRGFIGEPCWLALGGEVYHVGEKVEARKQVLSFNGPARWFAFDASDHPLPERLEEVPAKDRGIQLSLGVFTTRDPSLLVFELKLQTSDRPALRAVQHRWTNTLPFLFALYADRTAIAPVRSPRFGIIGGVNWSVELVPARALKAWRVTVNGSSILDYLPHKGPQTVHIVAAFGEAQHDCFLRERMKDSRVVPGPQQTDHEAGVVVRSNVVCLRWNGNRWHMPAPDGRAGVRVSHLPDAAAPEPAYDATCEIVEVEPNPARVGERVWISLDMSNRGKLGIPANAYDVQLYVQDELIRVRTQGWHMSPGGGWESTVPYRPSKAGRHTIRVVIDSKDHLREIDEHNNVATESFNVVK